MIGMGMIMADDALRPVTQFPHQVELYLGIDKEAVTGIVLGDVGTGRDLGHQDVTGVIFAARQQSAAFLRVGGFGGSLNLIELRLAAGDHCL